jgi:hypothetical protein
VWSASFDLASSSSSLTYADNSSSSTSDRLARVNFGDVGNDDAEDEYGGGEEFVGRGDSEDRSGEADGDGSGKSDASKEEDEGEESGEDDSKKVVQGRKRALEERRIREEEEY